VNATAPAPEAPLTVLLHAWQQGDARAFEQIVGRVHGELLRMAASRLRTGDGGTFSRGDLLNAALLRVMESPPDWQNRSHFFATVSLTMRSVLVDHARARLAEKRGGAFQRVTWTLSSLGEESMAADLLTLDQLLKQLETEDPRAAQILQLTYFAGLHRQDVATVLGVSVPTVDRDLRFARAWLTQQLGRDLEA
jgi:RNA polymerase sigma factor (TIGR02999 family)